MRRRAKEEGEFFEPTVLVPPHLRRPFIHSAYRFDFDAKNCVYSVFRLHNETLNIWSHILGFALFIGAHAVDVASTPSSAPAADRAMHHLFFVCCELCMLFSFTYHTFACHEREALARRLLQLDLVGICLMIGGSFLPGLYYGFYCFPLARHVYCVVNAGMVLSGFVFAAVDLEHKPRLNRMRRWFYAGIVGSAVVPTVHWLCLAPGSVASRFAGKLALMLALYAAGFGVYAAHVPERWAPGRFDLVGHSHQLWHVLVVMAGLVWATELSDYAAWIHSVGCSGY